MISRLRPRGGPRRSSTGRSNTGRSNTARSCTVGRTTALGSTALTVTLLALAGCGSVPAAGHGSGTGAAATVGPALATTLSSSNGTNWAVLDLGGSAASHDNFWELFVRPPGSSSRWQLATPPGVASNGGLVVAQSGAGALISAFRPSQDLTFSPLAATVDAGQQWTQNNVLDTGLADRPGALAAGPGGQLLALTVTGTVESGTHLGATWTRLTTLPAIARSAGVRASCSLTALTAAAWTASGTPVLGGSCAGDHHGQVLSAPRRAAILAGATGSWRLIGPVLPAKLAGGPVTVLGLASNGTGMTAILAAGSGPATSVLAAWSADGGTTWTLSPALTAPDLRTTAGARPSVSMWSDGAAGLLLAGGRAVTIGWQAASWRILPRVPARTAALGQSATGQPEALAPAGGALAVWQLAGGTGTWTRLQTVHVTVPYGSSG